MTPAPERRTVLGMAASFVRGQEAEKQNLARELHDVLSQKLAVVGLELSSLGQRPPRSQAALRERLQALGEQIDELAGDIHQMSRRLHPVIVKDLGLPTALKNECSDFSRRCGVRVKFTATGCPATLPSDISLCLYRVAQESLRNIARHAGKAEVAVVLAGNAREIVLSVQDTGKGFNPKANRRRGGVGLASMEERVRLVNGRFSVVSQPGKGVRVEVRVPLECRKLV